MKTKIVDRMLNFQLFLNLLIAGYLLIDADKHLGIQVVLLIILLYLTGARLLGKNQRIREINLGLEIIFLPILLTYYLNWLVISLIHRLPILKLEIVVVYLVTLMIYLLPTVMVSFGKIKNNWLRVLSIIYLALILLTSLNMNLSTSNNFINDLLKVNIVPGLALLILTPFLLKQWGFKFRMNFLPPKKRNFQLGVLILLVIFAVWLSFFNTYIYVATVPEQLFFNWDLSILVPTEWAVLRSVGAAICEETERYLILVVLLYLARNSKYQIQVAVFLSAVQFGLLHLINFRNYDANASAIFYEVLYTFGYGCFLAVLYLYSGQIWLTMLSHFVLDLVSYSVGSGGAGFLSLYGNVEAIGGVTIMTITLLVTILMLGGKRKRTMQANAARMIERI